MGGYDLRAVRVTINRIFSRDKEELIIQNAVDRNNQPVQDLLELEIQSLVSDTNAQNDVQTSFWLDNGAFNLN